MGVQDASGIEDIPNCLSMSMSSIDLMTPLNWFIVGCRATGTALLLV